MFGDKRNTHLGSHGRLHAREGMSYPFQGYWSPMDMKGHLEKMYISWIKIWWYIKIPYSGDSKKIVMHGSQNSCRGVIVSDKI